MQKFGQLSRSFVQSISLSDVGSEGPEQLDHFNPALLVLDGRVQRIVSILVRCSHQLRGLLELEIYLHQVVFGQSLIKLFDLFIDSMLQELLLYFEQVSFLLLNDFCVVLVFDDIVQAVLLEETLPVLDSEVDQ